MCIIMINYSNLPYVDIQFSHFREGLQFNAFQHIVLPEEWSAYLHYFCKRYLNPALQYLRK